MTPDFLKRMLLVSLVVVPAAGYPQEATFTGAVTDSTAAGAVEPRATVTAVHEASGNTFMAVIGGRGEVRLPLRVGSLQIAGPERTAPRARLPATSATTV